MFMVSFNALFSEYPPVFKISEKRNVNTGLTCNVCFSFPCQVVLFRSLRFSLRKRDIKIIATVGKIDVLN